MIIAKEITNLSTDIQNAMKTFKVTEEDVKSIEMVACIATRKVDDKVSEVKFYHALPDSIPDDWQINRGYYSPDRKDQDNNTVPTIFLSKYDFYMGTEFPVEHVFTTLIHEIEHAAQYKYSSELYFSKVAEYDANIQAIAYLRAFTKYPISSYKWIIDMVTGGNINVEEYVDSLANSIFRQEEI